MSTGWKEKGHDGTHVLVPEVLLRYPLDVLSGDLVNDELDLLGRHAAAAGDELAADILRNGGGAVKAEEQARLELALGALDLDVRGGNRHACPLLEREVRHVVHVHQVLGDEVDTPQAGVRVARRERHVAVREPVRGDDVRQARGHEPRRAERAVPVPEDALHDQHREVVG